MLDTRTWMGLSNANDGWPETNDGLPETNDGLPETNDGLPETNDDLTEMNDGLTEIKNDHSQETAEVEKEPETSIATHLALVEDWINVGNATKAVAGENIWSEKEIDMYIKFL